MMGAGKCSSPDVKIRLYLELVGKLCQEIKRAFQTWKQQAPDLAHSIIIQLGLCNKTPQTSWLKQRKFIFSQSRC